MTTRDLLLEIGIEEIPARFMPSALRQMEELAVKALEDARLTHGAVKAYGTPRRLALLIRGMEERQRDLREEVKGPPARIAFDQEGRPTKAAEGFARSQGVRVEDLKVRSLDGGDYLFAMKESGGRNTAELLPDILAGVIGGLSFPKPMRWGYGEMRFARPIRWLVALWGREVVPLELAGVRAGRVTRGHRVLSRGEVGLEAPGDYLDTLRQAGVIADQEERRLLIWQQIEQLASAEGGRVEKDEELLEEVTFLVEYPTALVGSFDTGYLALPDEVIITPMQEHQRYFPLRGSEGKLLPRFITVKNGSPRHLDTVRQGNEKVLRARLSDAQFFYQEDLKVLPEDRVEKLETIVFQESLGTMKQKVSRIKALSSLISGLLGLDADTQSCIRRAALLAKTDLVSNMVYEFPELQGIMGGYYAAAKGEAPLVAAGIREHYQPRFAGDRAPSSMAGAVVGLADKLDTLAGFFSIGITPTGSQDPYALRRQASGICQIILEHSFALSLSKLIRAGYSLYSESVEVKLGPEEVETQLADFFKLRLEGILADRGFSYDVINAVLASGWDDISQTLARAEAVHQFRQDPDFPTLLVAYNRVANLARHASSGGTVDPQLFEEEAEGALFSQLAELRKETDPLLASGAYLAALNRLAALGPTIDRFFEEVMVMVDDPAVKENRLALLKNIADYFCSVADLSRIVVE